MRQDYKNIEDLFKQSFEGYTVEPDADVWKGLSNKLMLKQFLSFNFRSFNIYYLTAVVIVIGVLSLMFEADNNKFKIPSVEKFEMVSKKLVSPPSSFFNNKIETDNDKKVENLSKFEHDLSDYKSNANRKGNKIKKDIINLDEITPIERVKPILQIDDNLISDISKLKSAPPNPLFKLNERQGCVPFKVEINNLSKFANTYEWDFGNGDKSTNKNPEYTYTEPGIYTITMKANGLGGTAVSFIDSIVVHNKTNNETKLNVCNKVSENEEFSVEIKDDKLANYKWYFGDGETSKEKTAVHSYKQEGVYSISLASLTRNNCYDSTVLKNVVVLKYPNKIVFPNAFSPNTSGSSGGKYSSRDLNNDVFHPIIVGTVKEYELKIYAKTGIIVFETKDISIGWDGYYKNKLMPEGVYPYVVTIKFEGDKNEIRKCSNVTLFQGK